MIEQGKLPPQPSSQDMDAAIKAHATLVDQGISPQLGARLYMTSGDFGEGCVDLPPAAVEFLLAGLAALAAGKAVCIQAIPAELPVFDAAQLLGVSNEYLGRLIETGVIPSVTRGWTHRVLYTDLLAYKEGHDSKRRQALADLAKVSQELGLGY